MTTWITDFWDTVRLIASIATGIAVFVPESPLFSRAERWVFSLIAGATAFIVFPDDVRRCLEIASYKHAAVSAILITICGAVGLIVITRQYVYDQISLDDARRVSKLILGGAGLTAEARAVASMNPKVSRQDVFAMLQYDPGRMWNTWSRTAVFAAHRTLALITGIALIAALTYAASVVLLAELTRRSHKELSLSLTSSAVVRTGRYSVPVHASISECDPTLRWTIDAPSWAGTDSRIIGEVSPEGNYFPPEVIRRNVDIYIVATPLALGHDHERRQVQIQLRAEPGYVQAPLPATGVDAQGKEVKLLIKVLDERYSWEIGKTKLRNTDGLAFVQQMAADGVFDEAKQIICVGAASREYVTKSAEEARAMDRALTLSNWVSTAINQRKPVWALKVGRFNAEDRRSPAETASERQVVIVGVLNAEAGVDMLSAVRDAFEQTREDAPVLGRYLDNYPASHWAILRVGAAE